MKKETPILFSTPMMMAYLNGRKIKTRRTKGLETFNTLYSGWKFDEKISKYEKEIFFFCDDNHNTTFIKCKYGQAGDILWVRETFREVFNYGVSYNIYQYKDFKFSEDWCNAPANKIFSEQSIFSKWKPSIHMPKKICRLWLEITSVNVERLLDITEADAIAEGVEIIQKDQAGTLYRDYMNRRVGHFSAIDSFLSLWESINGKESLEQNPYVWVIEFKKTIKP